MPHDREDQRALFGGRREPVVQRERASNQRRRDEESPGVRDKLREIINDPNTRPEEETERFLGLSPRTPNEIFNQRGRTTGTRALLGELFEGGKSLVGTVVESTAEGIDLVNRALDTPLFGDPETFAGIQSAIDPNRRVAQLARGAASALGTGEIEGDQPPELAPTAPGDARHEIAVKAAAAASAKKKLEEVDSTLEQQELDPADQLVLAETREIIEVELAKLEVELLDLQNALGVQDVIFDIAARDSGLADHLDLEPLEKALKSEGGLGHQTYQAILDLANNAALSEKERDEAIDIVLARQHFSQELINTVNDLVQNKTDLVELQERPDWEILDDPAAFLNPQVNYDVTGDNDAQRFENDMKNTFDSIIEVPFNIPDDHPSLQTFDLVTLLVMEFGVDHATVQEGITEIATAWGVEETSLNSAFKAAREQALINKEAWDEVLDDKTSQARPFSGSLVAAIWQAGELIGWNPDQLEMAAKSRALHALIETKSNGVSGIKGQGTIAGIGGLTMDMYQDMMKEEWTPDRGMAWELQALLEYINRFFQGDALKALTFYFDSGEWGGTESFPDG